MNEEQKNWYQQYSASFGVKELFRFGCAFAIWQGLGIGLSLWSGNIGYLLIWFATYLTFQFLPAYWQPAYSFLRIILGNQNMPPKLMLHTRKWWSYIPLVIVLAISTIFLIKGIEFLIK